ncbi:hypothetical protein [Rathayibacter toxicus]|uniref:Uncharacterized protein n=1 Tax=Rathayibacter toxicus TaxID=145458 RepID=A0A0C5BRC6_9MICO|nr:hypothetical protein [Rathayibacter toxicus]AJM77212.1 hypothetical protein TI83_03050 [Rathayibacter toxicus]ALS56933.1 hypothetical protein APU90_03420 [Rathayibacter toxicus]KKM46232.1 hypothetical protein VT73_04075 [Rathayibacter toxicus]PPG23194.1 hypothetical protein C5D15_02840 [Rathayibacter toxicus]PPG47778.1 hypothetical protein C5D16_02835 [Rathayibacter toxicus]
MKNTHKKFYLAWSLFLVTIPAQAVKLASGPDATNLSSWIFLLILNTALAVLLYSVTRWRIRTDDRRPL